MDRGELAQDRAAARMGQTQRSTDKFLDTWRSSSRACVLRSEVPKFVSTTSAYRISFQFVKDQPGML